MKKLALLLTLMLCALPTFASPTAGRKPPRTEKKTAVSKTQQRATTARTVKTNEDDQYAPDPEPSPTQPCELFPQFYPPFACWWQ